MIKGQEVVLESVEGVPLALILAIDVAKDIIPLDAVYLLLCDLVYLLLCDPAVYLLLCDPLQGMRAFIEDMIRKKDQYILSILLFGFFSGEADFIEIGDPKLFIEKIYPLSFHYKIQNLILI